MIAVYIGGIVLCALAGAGSGYFYALRSHKYRDRAWLRLHGHKLAVSLQAYFGSPLVLINMLNRAQKQGHDYTKDKQFRKGLERTIWRAFGIGEGA